MTSEAFRPSSVSFNLSILECKYALHDWSDYTGKSFNLSILECKYVIHLRHDVYENDF